MDLQPTLSSVSRLRPTGSAKAHTRWHRFALEFLSLRRWPADSANLGAILDEIDKFLTYSGRSAGLLEHLESTFPEGDEVRPARRAELLLVF